MTYIEALTSGMELLAQSGALFVGQSVAYDGQAMYPTLSPVPPEQRIEMPVAEDFQMGFCIGLALEGFLPVCIYPRFDFLLIAANQLVNHLDKLPIFSDFKPKIIIRTAVGGRYPIDPGPQHTQNHTTEFTTMCKTVKVVELWEANEIVPAYKEAMKRDLSTLLVEHALNYHSK